MLTFTLCSHSKYSFITHTFCSNDFIQGKIYYLSIVRTVTCGRYYNTFLSQYSLINKLVLFERFYTMDSRLFEHCKDYYKWYHGKYYKTFLLYLIYYSICNLFSILVRILSNNL